MVETEILMCGQSENARMRELEAEMGYTQIYDKRIMQYKDYWNPDAQDVSYIAQKAGRVLTILRTFELWPQPSFPKPQIRIVSMFSQGERRDNRNVGVFLEFFEPHNNPSIAGMDSVNVTDISIESDASYIGLISRGFELKFDPLIGRAILSKKI
jgi:hypothetical protein